jgi:predicted unusual protein kinase regulating ubiquinone biosynthesis (AarF/ABC1/UbiB family)
VSDAELARGDADAAPSGDGIRGGRVRRAAPLVGLTARTAGEGVVVGVSSKLRGSDTTEFHVRTAERYTELLGRSKGALMKAGQMLAFASAAPGGSSEVRGIYQTALMRLCSDAPPMAPRLARAVLEQELGCTTESAFRRFDWKPLAAASIGQVHAAQLHDGRAVAVKIQYPGVASAIASDLENTELLATLIGLIVSGASPWRLSFDVHGVARELGERIAGELDYRAEAANQSIFAEHYRGHPFIHVPDVVERLCTDRVLTQELVSGLSWSDAIAASQELRDQWAEAIWRFVYGAPARLGLLHADPHPGNYLFHEDGSVSFLDFGCVRRFRREQLEMIDAIVRECLRGDVHGTWRACVEAGFWRSTDPVTAEEVYAYWRTDFALLWSKTRFLVTPEYVARRIERRCSPTGPSANALRYTTMPPEYTIMGRIEIGVASLIAHLRAANRWGLIASEQLERTAPATEMGKREHEFFEQDRVAGCA